MRSAASNRGKDLQGERHVPAQGGKMSSDWVAALRARISCRKRASETRTVTARLAAMRDPRLDLTLMAPAPDQGSCPGIEIRRENRKIRRSDTPVEGRHRVAVARHIPSGRSIATAGANCTSRSASKAQVEEETTKWLKRVPRRWSRPGR